MRFGHRRLRVRVTQPLGIVGQQLPFPLIVSVQSGLHQGRFSARLLYVLWLSSAPWTDLPRRRLHTARDSKCVLAFSPPLLLGGLISAAVVVVEWNACANEWARVVPSFWVTRARLGECLLVCLPQRFFFLNGN